MVKKSISTWCNWCGLMKGEWSAMNEREKFFESCRTRVTFELCSVQGSNEHNCSHGSLFDHCSDYLLVHCSYLTEHVKYVVLDEGDKLLSPGLIEDCEVLRQAMFHNKDVNPQVRFLYHMKSIVFEEYQDRCIRRFPDMCPVLRDTAEYVIELITLLFGNHQCN